MQIGIGISITNQSSGGGGVPVSAGPFSFTSFSNDASVGDKAWITPGNTFDDDGFFSVCSALPGGQSSNRHKSLAISGAEAIPDAANVSEITISVRRFAAGGSANDTDAILVVGGVVQADNQKALTWPSSEESIVYTFAVSLTGAQVKAADFGFVFRGENAGGTPSLVIDSIVQASVTYTN
jgi:hypothetical protein